MRRTKAFALVACFLSILTFWHGSSAEKDPPRGELKIVYAINAGGDAHEDIHGIVYLKDPSNQGIVSDFGRRLDISRVHPRDQILYQTERYSTSSFGYDIPIKEDGNYVLVLKFSEVYFRTSNAKIFNVILNTQHKVVEDLDIFSNAGHAAAYDEIVPFIVTDHAKKLIVGTSSSKISGNRIRLDFIKGHADNPKVNAFFVAKGSVEDIPRLSDYQADNNDDEEEAYEEEDDLLYGDDDEEIQFSRSDLGHTHLPIYRNTRVVGSKVDIRSGPVGDDPWEFQSNFVIYMPLFASVAVSVVSVLFLRFVNQKM